MIEMDSRYHVDDRVYVKGVRGCAYGWNDFMEELCGCVATILRVEWDQKKDQYKYKIYEDDGWTWDDSCFEPAMPELEEFDPSSFNIFDLFS